MKHIYIASKTVLLFFLLASKNGDNKGFTQELVAYFIYKAVRTNGSKRTDIFVKNQDFVTFTQHYKP